MPVHSSKRNVLAERYKNLIIAVLSLHLCPKWQDKSEAESQQNKSTPNSYDDVLSKERFLGNFVVWLPEHKINSPQLTILALEDLVQGNVHLQLLQN